MRLNYPLNFFGNQRLLLMASPLATLGSGFLFYGSKTAGGFYFALLFVLLLKKYGVMGIHKSSK